MSIPHAERRQFENTPNRIDSDYVISKLNVKRKKINSKLLLLSMLLHVWLLCLYHWRQVQLIRIECVITVKCNYFLFLFCFSLTIGHRSQQAFVANEKKNCSRNRNKHENNDFAQVNWNGNKMPCACILLPAHLRFDPYAISQTEFTVISERKIFMRKQTEPRTSNKQTNNIKMNWDQIMGCL